MFMQTLNSKFVSLSNRFTLSLIKHYAAFIRTIKNSWKNIKILIYCIIIPNDFK